MLLKEMDVCGPNGEYRHLGQWLVDLLQSMDKTRGGSTDPRQADREILYRLNEMEKLGDTPERIKERNEIVENFRRDLFNDAYDRTSVWVNRGI